MTKGRKKRLASGVPIEESQEFDMGRIEAETYAPPCRRAGYTQGEAEIHVLLSGLYPYWLVETKLETVEEKKAHDAWLKGIERSVNLEYQEPPVPDAKRTKTLQMRPNPKAEARRRFVQEGRHPTARARLEAVERARQRQAARDRAAALGEEPGAVAGEPPTLLEVRTAASQETSALEAEFHDAMLDIYTRAGREAGYWATRFLQAVRRHGGLEQAHRTLQPKSDNSLHTGLLALMDAGRPDISVEALVSQPRFASLFSEAERDEARRRLERFPDAATRRSVEPADNFAEALPQNLAYKEGAVRTVTVNAYERSSGARQACLAKHGYACAVCKMSFEKVYGPIGKGFIHVHHKKPLGTIREAYQLDPEKDLVPVCPNCHAMLHTSSPPLSVSELKAELERHQEHFDG